MEINGNRLIIAILGVALIISLVYGGFITWKYLSEKAMKDSEKDDKQNALKEAHRIKVAYLDLFARHIVISQSITEKDNPNRIDLTTEIERLKQEIDGLGEDVHTEISEVISQVSDGKFANAVRVLAKIVEAELKEKVPNDPKFKGPKLLANLLEHAKEMGLIKPHLYEFGRYLTKLRNQESHELNVRLEKSDAGLAILSGIQILYALNAGEHSVAAIV